MPPCHDAAYMCLCALSTCCGIYSSNSNEGAEDDDVDSYGKELSDNLRSLLAANRRVVACLTKLSPDGGGAGKSASLAAAGGDVVGELMEELYVSTVRSKIDRKNK